MFSMDINDEHNSRMQERWAGIHSHPVSVPINQSIINNNKSSEQNELFQEIMKLKPAAAEGVYVKSVFMSSTMSPSIQIDAKTIDNA